MNFLAICQKVHQLVGLQGTLNTVTGATGYQKKLIDTVATCWEDIQNYRKNWLFNQSTRDFSTVIGQTEYTINDIFGTTTSPVREYRFIIRNDDQSGLNAITKIQYDLSDLVNEPQDKVKTFAIDDVTGHIHLNPPNEIVSLKVYYYNNLQTLSADSDIPICPSEFHNVIVYKAISEVALFFGSSELVSLYVNKYKYELGSLLRSQNPSLSIRVP